MKNLRFGFLLVYILSTLLFIFKNETVANGLTFYPSAYFVKGNYSDERRSENYSFYNTVKITDRFYFTGAFEKLKLTYTDFTLGQNNYLAGGYLNRFPFFFKIYYSHIDSDVLEINSSSNLISGEVFYFIKPFYFGTAYSFYKINDEVNTISNQVTLRLDWIINPIIYLSIRPNFTHAINKQKFLSLSGKLSFSPTSKFTLKAAGAIGKRIYYFDNNLLIIFNQPEIQKSLLTLQCDYNLLEELTITGGFQKTEFSGYTINHFIIGLKSKINLKF